MKITLSELYKAIKEQADYVNLNNTINSLEYCKTEINLEEKSMKYKVGDKVRICEDLTEAECISQSLPNGAERYAGRVATVIATARLAKSIRLDLEDIEDDEVNVILGTKNIKEFWWSDKMLDQN